MNANRKSSITIGILFIAATVFSILGLVSYGPILNNLDYIANGPTSQNQVVMGALYELIAAVSMAGTAIAFFPVLKKRDESRALGYVAFRLLEAILVVIGLVSLLSLLTLRLEYASRAALDLASLQVADRLLRAVHTWSFMLGPNFIFAINTLLYTSLLYQTKLVPRPIAVLGLFGAISIFIAAILEMFGVILQISTWGAVLSFPVAVYEMVLAVYLIVKGFRPSAFASESAYSETGELIVSPS